MADQKESPQTETLILSVDDEERNRDIIQKLLKKYLVVSVCSGEEALEILEEVTPAVILLDIMMPGIDGYEVCSQVKKNPRLKFTKVILVSGKGSIEERLKGYECGADDYLVKPFDTAELRAKVKVFNDLYQTQKSLDSLNENLEGEVHLRTSQLLKAERMASIGMQAAQIVHNLKGPLTVMKFMVGSLQEEFPDHKKIGRMGKTVDKFGQIVSSILSGIGQHDEGEKKNVNLNEVLLGEQEFLQAKSQVENSTQIELLLSDLPAFTCHATHFHQVFGNLIKNAAEAMIEKECPQLVIRSQYLEQEKKIEVSFKDNGCGIPAEDIEKIFEPLYTTKKGQNDIVGSGLGMPFCKKLIEFYGGQLAVESVLGQGTTIKISLPVEEGMIAGEESLVGAKAEKAAA